MNINEYKLRKWSRLVRLRDEAECQMCGDKPGVFKLEAHHVYPKQYEKYFSRIYDLSNGISLCEQCHLRVVHSSAKNWKRFTTMFRMYMKRKAIKTFNKGRQSEL
jgi:5-methylcytosine-specific restriction endonuclease McrA